MSLLVILLTISIVVVIVIILLIRFILKIIKNKETINIVKYKKVIIVSTILLSFIFLYIHFTKPHIHHEGNIQLKLFDNHYTLLHPSPDGRFFEVIDNNDRQVLLKVFDTNEKKIVATYKTPVEHFDSGISVYDPRITWSHQSTEFIAKYDDKFNNYLTLQYDVKSKKIKRLNNKEYYYFYSHDGTEILVKKQHGIEIIDAKTYQSIQTYQFPQNVSFSVKYWSKDHQDVYLEYYTDRNPSQLVQLEHGDIHYLPIEFTRIFFKNKNEFIYTSLDDKTYYYNLSTKGKKMLFDKGMEIKLNSSGTLALVGSDFAVSNTSKEVYDTKTWKKIYTLPSTWNYSEHYIFWLDDHRIIDIYRTLYLEGFLGVGNTLAIYDTKTGRTNKIRIKENDYDYLAKDAKKLFIAYRNGTVGVYSFPK